MRKLVVFLAVGGLVAGASAALLYDNGPFITHPGQGYNGADLSMCSLNPNSGGSNMRQAGTGLAYYRCADDFIVPAGGWNIDGIRTYGYATGAAPGTPGWTGFEMKVWSGAQPGIGTPVYTTTVAPTIAFTNVYRCFNGVFVDNTRAINRMDWAIPAGGLALPAGQYWIDVQVQGGTSGWWNYVMDPNPTNPNDPITRVGNAMQVSTGGTWIAAVAGTPSVQVTFPFQITPEPASLVLLGLGLLLRRR